MKVKEEKPAGFQPVTLTIESELELRILFLSLREVDNDDVQRELRDTFNTKITNGSLSGLFVQILDQLRPLDALKS